MQRVTDERGLDAAIRGKKAVVLFHTTWCPFCRSFAPTFAKATGASNGAAPIEAVIDDEANPLWDKYRIEIVPSVLFFEGGAVVKRLDGVPGVGLKAPQLEAALRAF